MYKVIGTVTTRAFRVMWALEELGQPYEIVAAGPRSEEARKYNPLGKIPALVDGKETLTDSVAIMTYLADKHGALTAPAGTIARARQDAMTLWLVDEFDAVLWAAAKHSFVFPEERRVPEIKPSLRDEFAHNVEHFATRIEGPFVMGDTFTIADILAVHCLNWAIGAKFPVENAAVNAYAKSLRAREAFKSVRAKAE
ncbi:glutathione S-transferase family protein [Aliishimia ponticola]|uniref:Glutathione S-transferase family protein n=1 Tax=Aliishimia ponticola TaxID=2499833 RepID=A0A4S4NKF2_9RHOB|nr:glutathione S-transferase family protein [Aliishimia ponticola]THH36620.1 glutathione S-transferase family protein [Aliishimia ponticola]